MSLLRYAMVSLVFSLSLSVPLTMLLVGGRLYQYGLEKVAGDWYFHVGLFVFLFVGCYLIAFIGLIVGNRGT